VVVGRAQADARAPVASHIAAKQEFAGYWGVSAGRGDPSPIPRIPIGAGTGLISSRGELIGIGSLQLEREAATARPSMSNMTVPIDLLKPVLDDLRKFGPSQ